jgi:hypothetical protein
MLRKLTMVVVAIAVIGISSIMMPQKAEAAWVTHFIRTPEEYVAEEGTTGIRKKKKVFYAGSYIYPIWAKVWMGWIKGGKTWTWAKIYNRKSRYRVKVKGWSRKYKHYLD